MFRLMSLASLAPAARTPRGYRYSLSTAIQYLKEEPRWKTATHGIHGVEIFWHCFVLRHFDGCPCQHRKRRASSKKGMAQRGHASLSVKCLDHQSHPHAEVKEALTPSPPCLESTGRALSAGHQLLAGIAASGLPKPEFVGGPSAFTVPVPMPIACLLKKNRYVRGLLLVKSIIIALALSCMHARTIWWRTPCSGVRAARCTTFDITIALARGATSTLAHLAHRPPVPLLHAR